MSRHIDMNVNKLIRLKKQRVTRRMSVSQQQQLGSLFCEVKFVIFITFESRDTTCSKIEKAWLLLVHWVAKNSLVNEKNPETVVPRCSVKKDP